MNYIERETKLLLILTYYYHLKWVLITQRVHSLWVCFTPDGVIQSGYIFKSLTHTSRHFDIGVAPPPGNNIIYCTPQISLSTNRYAYCKHHLHKITEPLHWSSSAVRGWISRVGFDWVSRLQFRLEISSAGFGGPNEPYHPLITWWPQTSCATYDIIITVFPISLSRLKIFYPTRSPQTATGFC